MSWRKQMLVRVVLLQRWERTNITKLIATLMYVSKCWRCVNLTGKAWTQRILRIHWHETFSNADPYTRTNSELLSQCIENKRLWWLGHVHRMKEKQISKRAFQWTSQGRCRAGRSGATWRSTITKELSEIGMTWGEAKNKDKRST